MVHISVLCWTSSCQTRFVQPPITVLQAKLWLEDEGKHQRIKNNPLTRLLASFFANFGPGLRSIAVTKREEDREESSSFFVVFLSLVAGIVFQTGQGGPDFFDSVSVQV